MRKLALVALAIFGFTCIHAADGKVLYKKCASCHGESAQKVAPRGHFALQGLQAKQIEDMLRGYKTGAYGGKMKALMRGQIANYSDDDIKAVSEYISTLK